MKTASKLALVAALAASASVADAKEVARCEGTTDSLGVTSLTPNLENHVLTLDMEGKTLKTLERGAKTVVKVAALGIPLYSESIDLCAQDGVQCPIPAGSKFDFTIAHDVSRELPASLDIDVTIDTYNDAEQVSCVKTEAKSVEHPLKEPQTGGVLSVSQGLQTELKWNMQHYKFLFQKWLEEFKSLLPTDIHHMSFMVFKDNLRKIVMHNLSGASYTMSMNQFGHMTEEEFARTMLGGFRNPEKRLRGELSKTRPIHEYNGEELPESVDWVAKGAVTPVKNQGACGSCWSFSTTGALEGAYYLKTGKLVSFSEEQLVTCDHVDMGCNGGLMDNAFAWIEKNGGICKEEDYPYVSGNGAMPACAANCKKVEGSAIKNFADVAHDEQSLESAVAQRPVAIAIEADQGAFQFYSGGVLTQRCGTQLDHGVLAVGYGTLDGTKYWKVKNSWGPSWGLKGYINIERGLKTQAGGECGILMSASYPIL